MSLLDFIPGVSQAKVAVVVAVALAIGGSVLAAKWQYDRANKLTEKLAKQEAANSILKDSIADLQKAQAEDQLKMNTLSTTASRIAEEKHAIEAKYNSYRGRIEKTALAKPDALAARATAAVERLRAARTEITGGHIGPADKKVQPAPAGARPVPE